MVEIKNIQNEKGGRFELYKDGTQAGLMTYTWTDETRFTINHTEVNENFSGLGLGKKLVEAAVNFAREHQKKIIPACSFAKAAMQKEAGCEDVIG